MTTSILHEFFPPECGPGRARIPAPQGVHLHEGRRVLKILTAVSRKMWHTIVIHSSVMHPVRVRIYRN